MIQKVENIYEINTFDALDSWRWFLMNANAKEIENNVTMWFINN